MSATPAEPTTSEDRTSALLAWILGVFTGFIGPLIIFLVRQEKSRFARFHAIQALLWHLAYLLLLVPLFAFIIIGGIFSAVQLSNAPHTDAPPTGIIAGFLGFWVVVVVFGLANLALQVAMGIMASSGSWTRLPLLGNWAAKLGKI